MSEQNKSHSHKTAYKKTRCLHAVSSCYTYIARKAKMVKTFPKEKKR